jgi:hypothetical protein
MDDSRVEIGRRKEPLWSQRWTQTLGLFMLVSSVFLLLPQRTLHGVDGEVFLSWIEQGRYDYPRHVAYLHLVGALHRLGEPLGMTALEALLLASALGSGLAAVCLHRMFRLLAPKPFRNGALPAFAAMSAGPCLYYATCAEIHGVFAGPAAAAWWAFARLLLEPKWTRAVVVGLCTGAAASVHAFGHVLLPTIALAAWSWGGPRRGIPLRWWAGAALAHGAVTSSLASALGVGASGQAVDILSYCSSQLSALDLATTPDVLAREWLLPAAPWSIAAAVGLFVRRARVWATATALALLLHAPFAVLLLGHHRIDEGGAYMIGVVPLAVLVAVRILRQREFVLATLAGFALSLWQVAPQWSDPVRPEFVQDFAAIQGRHKVALIVGKRHELDGVRTGVPGAVVIDLGAALHLWLEDRERGVSLPQWFDGWAARFHAMDLPVLLSQSALDFFAGTPEPEVRAFWDEHVPTRYAVVPERRHAFRGAFVLPLPETGSR